MRTLGLGIVMILFSLSVMGQQEKEWYPEAFNRIKLFGNIQIEATQADSNKVKFISDRIPLSELSYAVEDSTLSIKLTSKLFKDDKIYIELSYEHLKEVVLNASARMEIVSRIQQPAFIATVSTGGEVHFKADVEDMELNAYQGGQIVTKGTAQNLEAYANTGGILSATELKVKKADVKFNTGGKGEITVKDELKARVTMGSHLSYFGVPAKLDVKATLGGNISAWDEEKDNE